MQKTVSMLIIVFLSLVQVVYGQKNCNTRLVVGEWKMLKSIHWGIHTNVDSLKIISQGEKFSAVSKIQFNDNATYKINFVGGRNQRNGYFLIDTVKCEIILAKDKKNLTSAKYRERANLEVIYLDKEMIIYKEDNNPKSYATRVWLKD